MATQSWFETAAKARPPHHEGVSVETAYFPTQFGARFSENAFGPSM